MALKKEFLTSLSWKELGGVRSLQQYQGPTVQWKVEISKAFDLPLGDKVSSYRGEASVRKELSKREAYSVEIEGEIKKS